MEFAESIVYIVKEVGFPIAMCVALFWYMVDQRNKHKEETDKLSDAVSNNNTAINNNTEVLRLLLDREGVKEDV